MNRTMLSAGLVALTACATPALAQIPVGTYVGGPVSATAALRDPFVALVAPKRTPTRTAPDAPRGTGLRAMALADVEVTGIVRRGDLVLAILSGSGEQSYVARAKDRLLDAVIKRIDAEGVVFEDVVEPGTGARPQEIRKALRKAAEGSR